ELAMSLEFSRVLFRSWPAFFGAVVDPDPTAPAGAPLKYSSVAAGDRFVSPPTPSTVADAALAVPSYVEFAHVIDTLAAALPIVRSEERRVGEECRSRL